MRFQGDLVDNSEADAEEIAKNAGTTSLLMIAFFPSLVIVSIGCLYCFFSRKKHTYSDDEEDSKSAKSDELRCINDNSKGENNSHESRATRANRWLKLRPFFQTISGTTDEECRGQNSNQLRSTPNGPIRANSTSSATMGEKTHASDVTLTMVQPPNRASSQPSLPSTSRRKPSFIPDSFKLPFDPWLITDDNPAPQGADYIGRLEYSVSYAFDTLTLIVKIIKAIDLPAMDLSGTSDPFVKCCLLPDRKRKLETKIRRKTLNPTWNETLLFEGLSYDKIQQRVLYMQVLDWDRFSRNDPIGEICLPLHQIDLTDTSTQAEYLTPCSSSNKRGELLVSLCYNPVEGTIEIAIKQAKNLKPMDIGGTSDPYVKIWQLVRGKRMEKHKTATIKNSLNPTFEESFLFQSPMEILRETQFEISVMDRDKIGRNDTIGKIYLGTKSNSLEKKHWKEMLTKIRQPVEQWHILKV